MTVGELIQALGQFDPKMEFMVMGPPDSGDATFPILGLDKWEGGVGNGACVLSIQPDLEQEEAPVSAPTPNPEQIASQVGDIGPGSLGQAEDLGVEQ